MAIICFRTNQKENNIFFRRSRFTNTVEAYSANPVTHSRSNTHTNGGQEIFRFSLLVVAICCAIQSFCYCCVYTLF